MSHSAFLFLLDMEHHVTFSIWVLLKADFVILVQIPKKKLYKIVLVKIITE